MLQFSTGGWCAHKLQQAAVVACARLGSQHKPPSLSCALLYADNGCPALMSTDACAKSPNRGIEEVSSIGVATQLHAIRC